MHKGWSLTIFCARATRGLRRPSPGLMARPGKSIAKQSEGRAGEKYLPVGGRVRKSRAVGDQSGHPPRGTTSKLGRMGREWPGALLARRTRGLTHRRRLRLRLRLSNDQSDQAYSRPLTSTLALTFRWDVRSRGQPRPFLFREVEGSRWPVGLLCSRNARPYHIRRLRLRLRLSTDQSDSVSFRPSTST